ncbi:IclR family transcriptional regulator [Actinophytocola sp. S1-96]|uniref:IclR family transcriptional regulator n=2 Tax=Actinophytocola gossypii TaxID=2812003 RepID=A0ABT2JDU0_9PSEU|nr:IclR family transcriptional regulator [Actinophytocola gossypii]
MDSTEPLGVTEVAAELGMGKSVAHRVLRSLTSRNLVEQDPGTMGYLLGSAAVAMGARALSLSKLESEAAPLLRDLRDRTEETTLLSRPVAGGRVHVAQFESPRHVRMTVELGVFRPWHAGASGKILLAHADPEFRERAIALESEQYDLDQDAIAALNRDLDHARERGYVMSSGERNPDAGAVAAPVFGVRGVVIAAISVCGPRSRLTSARAERIAPLLLSVTRQVSARLS